MPNLAFLQVIMEPIAEGASNKSFGNIYPGIYRVHRDWLLNCRSTNLSLMSLGINGFVKKMLSTENKCKKSKN